MIVDPLNVVTWTRLTSLISMHTMGHNRMYDMAYKMLIFIVCWQCYPRCDKINKHKRTIECQWCGTTSRHVLCYFSLGSKTRYGMKHSCTRVNHLALAVVLTSKWPACFNKVNEKPANENSKHEVSIPASPPTRAALLANIIFTPWLFTSFENVQNIHVSKPLKLRMIQ